MNETHNKTHNKTDSLAPADSGADTSVVSSRELLGRNKRLEIEHNGERYTLRITSNNKLILTK